MQCCSWEGFNYCDLAKHLLNNNLQIVLHLIKSTPPPPPPLQFRSSVQWRSIHTHPPTQTLFLLRLLLALDGWMGGLWWRSGVGRATHRVILQKYFSLLTQLCSPIQISLRCRRLHFCVCVGVHFELEKGVANLYILCSVQEMWEACIVCGIMLCHPPTKEQPSTVQ